MRPIAVRDEVLWEFDFARNRILAMAEVLPPGSYDWKPSADARPVSAVLVHIAGGNFFLLDMLGVSAPEDLYFATSSSGNERMMSLIRQNQELERSVCHKEGVVALLRRSFNAVREALTHSQEEDFERRVLFLGEETTVRRVYLRMLVHLHEHMGQMLTYLRALGIPPPPVS